MNRIGRVFVTLSLVAFTSFAVFAQDQSEQPKKKRGYQHLADIITKYDKKKDQTKVELQWMPVRVLMDRRDHVLRLSVYYLFPGKTPSKPEQVAVIFTSRSQGAGKFQDKNEFSAEIDGGHVAFGTTELLESRRMSSYYQEVLGMFVPFDKFFDLVDNNKESLSMRVGNVKFELDRAEMEALRDLASRAEK
jgi:hypothetical protein